MEIIKEGIILYFYPYKTPNCSIWSYFFYEDLFFYKLDDSLSIAFFYLDVYTYDESA